MLPGRRPTMSEHGEPPTPLLLKFGVPIVDSAGAPSRMLSDHPSTSGMTRKTAINRETTDDD